METHRAENGGVREPARSVLMYVSTGNTVPNAIYRRREPKCWLSLEEAFRYRLPLAILIIELRNVCEAVKQFHIIAKHFLPILGFGEDDTNSNDFATSLAHQLCRALDA